MEVVTDTKMQDESMESDRPEDKPVQIEHEISQQDHRDNNEHLDRFKPENYANKIEKQAMSVNTGGFSSFHALLRSCKRNKENTCCARRKVYRKH